MTSFIAYSAVVPSGCPEIGQPDNRCENFCISARFATGKAAKQVFSLRNGLVFRLRITAVFILVVRELLLRYLELVANGFSVATTEVAYGGSPLRWLSPCARLAQFRHPQLLPQRRNLLPELPNVAMQFALEALFIFADEQRRNAGRDD
jgi:hypothetical protein